MLEDGTIQDEHVRETHKEYVKDRAYVRVPYTAERWQALERISAACLALGAKLAELLNAKADAVAGFLDDTAGVARLLPMPEGEPTKKKARR